MQEFTQNGALPAVSSTHWLGIASLTLEDKAKIFKFIHDVVLDYTDNIYEIRDDVFFVYNDLMNAIPNV
jgi:hypothetical protein